MSYPNNPYPPVASGFDVNEYQRRQDAEHLNLLSIFHYVMGGILALYSLFPLIYVAMGAFMFAVPGASAGPGAPPQPIGAIFMVLGLMGTAIIATIAGLTIQAGRCIAARRGHTFIMVTSCLNCLQMPLGTALGVFTLLVLGRPSVKASFGLPVSGASTDWHQR
jgi:hypothetical protein